MKQKYIVLSALIGLIAGLFFGAVIDRAIILARYALPAPIQQNQKANAASIMIDYGNGTVETIPNIDIQNGETLLAFLARTLQNKQIPLETKTYKGLGALVTKIGGKTNGANGAYWQYWVNGMFAEAGAAQYVVKPGDVIEWKFVPPQSGQ